MADYSGRKIAVGLAKEAVRGTAEATAAMWLLWQDLDFQPQNDKIYNDSVMNVLAKNNAVELIKEWAEGKIGGKVTDQAIGFIFLNLLGTVNSANHAGETTVKDHTFTESQSNTGQSLTLFRKDPNNDEAFPLAMLKTLEISCVVGDFLKFSATFISKKGVASTQTVAYVVENEFIAKHVTAKLATTVGGLAGASSIPVKSFKLTYDRKTDDYYVMNQTNEPGEIFAHEFDVKGELVLRHTDNTYKTLWASAAPQVLQIDVKNTAVTMGVASTNPEVKFTFYKTALDTWKLGQKPGDIVEQTVGLQMMHSVADAKMTDIVLTNRKTSY